MEKKESKIPQSLGDYRIKEEIYEGGQGKVFLGKHTARYGNYVLKQFKNSEDGVNEVEILRKLTSLENDNIIKCFNFLPGRPENKECAIIEMEYCSGGTLHDEIESCKENKEKFPEIQILTWLIQLANGLEAIHSLNIIHQDIKPKNILISKEGVLKFADFGVSRIFNAPEGSSIGICGTVPYFSPEALIHNTVTKKSDIWSLGVVAYQLCCLRCPYKAPDVRILKFIFGGDFNFPSPMPKNYSTDLLTIIKSMLQIEESNRPTASTLKRALQMAKAKNLCFLMKKYKKFGFNKTSLFNLVNCIPSPYCLRFFLKPDMQDEKFFDRAHCCRRMHKNKERISNLFFCKSGFHVEMCSKKSKYVVKMLFSSGISEETRTDKIIFEDVNKFTQSELSNFNIFDWISLLLYYKNNSFLPTSLK